MQACHRDAGMLSLPNEPSSCIFLLRVHTCLARNLLLQVAWELVAGRLSVLASRRLPTELGSGCNDQAGRSKDSGTAQQLRVKAAVVQLSAVSKLVLLCSTQAKAQTGGLATLVQQRSLSLGLCAVVVLRFAGESSLTIQ